MKWMTGGVVVGDYPLFRSAYLRVSVDSRHIIQESVDCEADPGENCGSKDGPEANLAMKDYFVFGDEWIFPHRLGQRRRDGHGFGSSGHNEIRDCELRRW